MTMPLEKAPTILTRKGAEKLTASIRRHLESADIELARAWEGRVWEALDLPDWAAWITRSFPELEYVKLTVPARQDSVVALRLVGASERDIAVARGVSPATIHADLVSLREAGRLNGEPTTTRSRDGRERPARQPATAMQDRAAAQAQRHGLTLLMAEAWERLEQAGGRGMTSLELERKTRWRHGRVSSLLHRLERAGLVYRSGEFRDDYGVYVARPLS